MIINGAKNLRVDTNHLIKVISSRTANQVGNLSVTIRNHKPPGKPQELILSGISRSYYGKQLAQEAVRSSFGGEIPPEYNLVNNIEVVKSAPSNT